MFVSRTVLDVSLFGVKMIKNYLTIAFRNILKNKLFTIINVAGLAIGMAVCFIIYLWVQDEISYDQFNSRADNIYRVERRWDFQDMHGQGANTSPPFGPVMVQDYQEIIDFVRLEKKEVFIKDHRNLFRKQKVMVSDNSIFQIFDFKLFKGDRENVLNQPNTIVLTQEIAMKYMGTNKAIGKTLTIHWEGEPVDFLVTGILNDVPANSHFNFEILISISSYPPEILDEWFNNNFYTYIILQDHISAPAMELKFPSLLSKYLMADFAAYFGPDIDVNDVFKIKLKPLTDIHLEPTRNFEIAPQGNKMAVYSLSIIAILILTIACINFINLSTANANKRAQEVGMRKAIGASRHQLWTQFLGESFLLASVSCIIAILMIEFLLPIFNQISGKEFSGFLIFKGKNLLILFLLSTITGLFAGIYPAFMLSAYDPIKAIKGSTDKTSNRINFRNGMTVIQFVISIALIISTIIIYQQMQYFQSKSLGFDKENVILVSTESEEVKHKLPSFRNSLIQSSHITSVSGTSNTLGNDVFWDTNFRRDDTDEFYNLLLLLTDYDFINTYNMRLLHGRNFSREYVTDKEHAFLINEQAAKTLGYAPEEAVGKKLSMTLGTDEFRESIIIGVVENFHFQSLHRRIEPLVMYIANPEDITVLAIKGTQGNIAEMIDHLNFTWEKIYPSEQLVFSFLDSRLDLLYKSEGRIQNLLTIFTVLSVFIASLGLLGLAIYSSESRRKEIGIRKVVGATVTGITLMLSRDFTKWVLMANLFAWPAAWYLMNLWLQNFSYKIELGWTVFILSGFISLIIALITVIAQAIKSAVMNPVESLRYE